MKSWDFSQATLTRRWDSGRGDMHAALRRFRSLPPSGAGVHPSNHARLAGYRTSVRRNGWTGTISPRTFASRPAGCHRRGAASLAVRSPCRASNQSPGHPVRR
jgi:hypothetical protein